jgi:GNAT superfamily N-acetyltransferase
MTELTLSAVQADPGLIAGNITVPAGIKLIFRPLTSLDAQALGRYFLSLSEATTELYGPHPFDQAAADRLCSEIDFTQTIRMLGMAAGNEILAYFILDWNVPVRQIERYAEYGLSFDPQACCQIAPSVCDTWQNHGLGSPLMNHIFEIARRLGRKHVMLTEGVYAHNTRAVHYYQKMGFRQAGTFYPDWGEGRPCYDMVRDL